MQDVVERFSNILGENILLALQKLAQRYKVLVPFPKLSDHVGVIPCISLKELKVSLHIDNV